MSASANIQRNAARLLQRVINPHSADFWLQKVNPLWTMQRALGKVIDIQKTAVDTVSLKITINAHFQMGQAGQHHPVFIESNGRRYERSYSLTQLDARHVLLTVKKVQQGMVSTWLCEHAKVGDLIEFGQPYGDMQLNTQATTAPATSLLLAAGSGITPMYSLIESIQQKKSWSAHRIHLMYWVKQAEDAAFHAQFEALAAQQQNFSYQLFLTQAETDKENDARLNRQHLDGLAPNGINLAQTAVYACGPSGFVAQATQLCGSAAQFKSEAFSLSARSQDEIDLQDGGVVNIQLLKSNKTLQIAKGQSILEALEQHDLRPTHGCRMGICNKCVCHKSQGETQNLLNGSQNTEPNQVLKICVNSAQSDLAIDL